MFVTEGWDKFTISHTTIYEAMASSSRALNSLGEIFQSCQKSTGMYNCLYKTTEISTSKNGIVSKKHLKDTGMFVIGKPFYHEGKDTVSCQLYIMTMTNGVSDIQKDAFLQVLDSGVFLSSNMKFLDALIVVNPKLESKAQVSAHPVDILGMTTVSDA